MRKLSLRVSIILTMLIISNHSFAQTNDNCSAALLITPAVTCTGTSLLTNQTLTGATNEGALSSSCAISTPRDVWYKFVANAQNVIVTISNLGPGWSGSTNVYLDLFSGSCGSFTEIACINGLSLSNSVANPLTSGTTYYIRVHQNSKNPGVPAASTFDICVTYNVTTTGTTAGRMNEIFSRTILSDANILNYPWEITYGNDDSLWITESRGYKVYKMNSTNGGKRMVLDLASNSTWFGNTGGAGTEFYAVNTSSWSPWPQGGFAGLAIHPQFGDGSHNFVYVTYVWKYISGTSPNGIFYQNKLVRFTYNYISGRLESGVEVDGDLPGSKDHNSQRLIIAPVVKGGTNYLFMGSGDMGAGQFENRYRTENAQDPANREGKILRYNLETVGGSWIPTDNPYTTLGVTNSVWDIGMRNNQGFAYDTATNLLYGSAHGPYSDDEINIIEKKVNYGHPLVIGYSSDGNYNGNSTAGTTTSYSAGARFSDGNSGNSSIAPVGNETTAKNAINAGSNGPYRDPLFSAYPSTNTTIDKIWNGVISGNNLWESEGWSGLDIYSNSKIPGWKRSLVAAGLKWGRLIRLPLDATGTKTMPSGIGGTTGNTGDTVTYFQSTNRYRDLAFGTNGKDIYLIMDNTSATSGPGVGNPVTPACPGCVIKYSFLGYADAGGISTIPKTIDVSTGIANNCNIANTVTIDATNNGMWVPITGADGNIIAEINAMGQNLGLVTTTVYENSGAIRTNGAVKYANRNLTITPANNSFATPVKIRLYLTSNEFSTFQTSSGIAGIANLRIHKNSDACGNTVRSSTTELAADNTTVADLTQGSSGYVLQSAVTKFSSFYFAAQNVVLPVNLISFTGTLQSDLSGLLQWKTENQVNVSAYNIERSVDGVNFNAIGQVLAASSPTSSNAYNFTDRETQYQNAAVVYYRLRIVDNDGSIKYSNIVKMILPGNKGLITIAPNPVSDNLKGTIISPVSGNAAVKIYDNAGRLVSNKTVFLVKGTNNLSENTSMLRSGIYYITVAGNGVNMHTKFQKK